MANPSQMFDHTLDAVKGWFHEAALDHSASLDTGAANQGMCVSLDSSGEFTLGLDNANAMPIFLLNSSGDPDVANAGGDYWVAISPTGKMSGLVATGGYELETTEFTAATYLPNQPLTATSAGLLFNSDGSNPVTAPWKASSPTTVPVVGVCSQGSPSAAPVENSHGVDVLRFWPVYIPGSG